MDTKKKNIWIVNHYAIPPNLGGLSRHYYFSKFLSKTEKYNVSIFSSSKIHNTDINKITDGSFYKQETIMDVPYTFIKTSDYNSNGFSRIKNMLEFPFRVQRLPKHFEKPDVIYTSSPTPFTAFSAIILAKRLKVPVIVEVRDLWPESVVAYNGMSKKNPIIMVLYALEKWIYKKATKLVFTMEGGKDYIKEKNWEKKIDLTKVENVNNGVDLEQFLKDKDEFDYKDIDLDNDDIFKITYAGSIRKVNNLGAVLEIAKEIKSRGLNKVRFLIFGDGNEKDELIQKCKDENIDNVVFKGKVS
ncbi:MAG: glycosyltransferase family 4 protein, partial [Oscillospiraceae bacterium]